MAGYCGKTLRVNLTTQTVATEPLDPALATKFIGGRGLGSYLFSQEVDPKIDPFSPDNKLIFATGPLTGTTAPTGGRYMVVTKSPLSGTIASSNSGGFWGAELKHAGYDIIIIEGKSAKPCYLLIQDDKVKLKDAAKYWGRLIGETTDALVAESGDPKSRVVVIGPAGEKRSLLAAIINDKYRAAGRSGVGAVMGGKNLKAIVVRGTGKCPPVDPEAAKRILETARNKIKENDVTAKGLPAYGTAILVNVINEHGMYPTNNFQQSSFAAADRVSGEYLAEHRLVKNVACYACPIACGRRSVVDGVEGEGPEYETLWAYSANCGVDDLDSVIRANNFCNDYGIDTISAGATIACAMELYQRGLITDDDLDGPPLEFGSGEAVVEWSRKMGAAEGFGAKLAQGSYRLAESCGHPELSMSVKKLEMPAYDPRGVQGHALNYATSNRGGCHVRGYMISPEILGIPEKLDRFAVEGKAVWVKIFQDLTAVIDSLGLCLFTSFALNADDYTALFNAFAGRNLTTEQLLLAGDRIYNLERRFNLAAGIDPSADTLPKRVLSEPVSQGPSKGHIAELDKLLPQYYKERGWDTSGIPTSAKLARLGIT